MKSIIFNSEMVKAILDGRKSQTRRITKPQPGTHHWESLPSYKKNMELIKTSTGLSLRCSHSITENRNEDGVQWINPKYQPGDRVYVKETWALPEPMDEETLVYKASCNELDLKLMYWKSPMFMPEWASRIHLEITNVRVERVRDISIDDCIAEGFNGDQCRCTIEYFGGMPACTDCLNTGWIEPPTVDFYLTWNTIYKSKPEYRWEKNPWVWVYEFKQESK